MSIVGHKIEQYLAITWVAHKHWRVTTHRVVTELHATKGWRGARRARHVQDVSKHPTWRQCVKDTSTRFEHADGYGMPRSGFRLKGIRP